MSPLNWWEESIDYPNIAMGGAAQSPKGTGDFNLQERIPKDFAGPVYADVVITYSGNNVEQVIYRTKLFDVLPDAWVKVSPSIYDFGVSPTTQNVTLNWTITNRGTKVMQVNAITSSNPSDTTWSEGPALPWTLQAGESKTVLVTLSTSGMSGPVSRTLTVSTTGRVDEAWLGRSPLRSPGSSADRIPSFHVPVPAGARTDGFTDGLDVSGDWIVWNDNRNNFYNIYAYNVVTGQEVAVTNLLQTEESRE